MYRALSTGGGLAYETGTSRLILAALEPDSVFVDVGANIGYFTVLGLSRLSSGGGALPSNRIRGRSAACPRSSPRRTSAARSS